MSNRFSRIVCGILSVVMCIFSTAHVTKVSAAVGTVYDVTNLNVISIQTTDICKINGSAINSETQVKDGDTISVDFVWSQNPLIPPETYPAPVTFAYNLTDSFYNVFVADQDLGTSITNTHYYIENNILYIEITEGTADRSGNCYLEGKVDIDQGDLTGDKVTVGIFDSFTVSAPSLLSEVSANKSAGELRYDENAKKFYQHFTVTVKNNSYTSGAYANNVVISDSYPMVSEGGVFSGDMLNYEVTTVRKDPPYHEISRTTEEVGTASPDYTVSVDKLNAQEEVIIEYDIEVNPKSLLDTSSNRTNTVEADYNNGSADKTATNSATIYPAFPSINKSASMNQEETMITWTITVNEGYLKDVDEAAFTVTDTFISNYIDSSDITDEHTGVTVNDNGTVTIDKALFTPAGDGVYTFTYTSDVPESLKESVFGTYVGNKADATFEIDDITYTVGATAGESVSGEIDSFVDKSGEILSNGNIQWTFSVAIPDDNNIKNLNIYDSCTQNQRILYNTLEVKDGATVLLNLNYDYQRDNEFQIFFGDSWGPTNDLSLIKDKTLTFTYETEIIDETSVKYQNTANVWVNSKDGGQVSDSDIATVACKATANKSGQWQPWYDNSSKRNSIYWKIQVNNSGFHTYSEGDVITITDALPSGHAVIDGTFKCSANGEALTPDSYSVSDGTLSVQVSLTAAAAAYLSLNEYCPVIFEYYTEMTEAEYNDFIDNQTDVDVTNTAEVIADGERHDVSSTIKVEYNDNAVLSKSASISENNDTDFKVQYTVVVNPNKADLVDGEDQIQLIDKMGYYLTLENVTYTASDPNAVFSYTCTDGGVGVGDTLTFTISDNTTYYIYYTVSGKKLSKGNTLDSSITSQLYSNTIYLKDAASHSSSYSINSSDYTARVGYTYSITVKGTKFWDNNDYDIDAPKSIVVKIEYDQYDALDRLVAENVEHNVSATVVPVNGVWEYTIGNLVYVDLNNNRFDYTIKEIEVDGYTVEYYDGVLSGDVYTLDMKNTFTAHKTELGSLKVRKVWNHGSNQNIPSDSVTVKLYEVYDGASHYVNEKTFIFDFIFSILNSIKNKVIIYFMYTSNFSFNFI